MDYGDFLVGRYISVDTGRHTKPFSYICKIIGIHDDKMLMVNILDNWLLTKDVAGRLLPHEPYGLGIDKVRNRDEFYFIKDVYLHREDGPALISADMKAFYLLGEKLTPEEHFNRLTEEQKEKVIWNLEQLL